MRITSLWIVLDATPVSEMADVCFEVEKYEDLRNWILGWALIRPKDDRNPTLYTTEREARDDAKGRLKARDDAKGTG